MNDERGGNATDNAVLQAIMRGLAVFDRAGVRGCYPWGDWIAVDAGADLALSAEDHSELVGCGWVMNAGSWMVAGER